MITKLTARTVESIKPNGDRAEYFDTNCRGLALRASPTGGKSWILLYRIGKRLRRWTIGPYPALGLADAHDRAGRAGRKTPDGYDPALDKQERREAGTFGELADLYITEFAQPRKRTWSDDRRLLNNEVKPIWRHRPAGDITRADVRGLIEAVAARPAPILANRARALLHRLFNWACEQEHATRNPVTMVQRPGVEKQRDRVLRKAEIRTLWKALDELPATMAAVYKLRLMTAQRGGEVADMRWSDVDLAGGWWTIPAERSKNKLPHRVPLTRMAVRRCNQKPVTSPRRLLCWLAREGNGNVQRRRPPSGSRTSSATICGAPRRP